MVRGRSLCNGRGEGSTTGGGGSERSSSNEQQQGMDAELQLAPDVILDSGS